MERNYYILKSGRLERKDNTLYLENEEGKKPIPVEDIYALYLFGEIDLNTKLLNFLSQHKITIHVFNYYGFYSGSYYPREYLLSGFLLVRQVEYYKNDKKRMSIAREFIQSASHNILKNLLYYRKNGKDVDKWISEIEKLKELIDSAVSREELMGIEGNIRQNYYQSFNEILKGDFKFEKRVKQPPDNMINCLISFGNSLVYTTCLSEIYHTQLNPTISFLHEPGDRRFSLSLDMAEIFKPILSDRTIFKLVNNQMLKEEHFDEELNSCYLNEKGRKIFLTDYEERLKTTIRHRTLDKDVSYQRLIRLECYKLAKHIMGEEEYESFKIWW